jgi:hypothetical protein
MVGKPNLSLSLEQDIAQGPMTVKNDRNDVFDFDFL